MSDTTAHPALRLTRRQALSSAAAAAGAAMLLAACGGSGPDKPSGGNDAGSAAKGSSKEPLARPAAFAEAPMLTDLVKAGKLPELAKRLPENP